MVLVTHTYEKSYPVDWKIYSGICWAAFSISTLLYGSTLSWFARQEYSWRIKFYLVLSVFFGVIASLFSCLYYTQGIDLFVVIQRCQFDFVLSVFLPFVCFVGNSFFITEHFTQFGQRLSHLKAFEYMTRTQSSRNIAVLVVSLLAAGAVTWVMITDSETRYEAVYVRGEKSGCVIPATAKHKAICMVVVAYWLCFEVFYANQWFRRLLLFAQSGPRVPSDKNLLNSAKQMVWLTVVEFMVVIPLAIAWMITCEPVFPTLIILVQAFVLFLKQAKDKDFYYDKLCGSCTNFCLSWVDNYVVEDYSDFFGSSAHQEFSEQVTRTQTELTVQYKLADERAKHISENLIDEIVDLCCDVLEKGIEFSDSLLLVAHQFNAVRVEYSLFSCIEDILGAYPIDDEKFDWLRTFVMPSLIWFKKCTTQSYSFNEVMPGGKPLPTENYLLNLKSDDPMVITDMSYAGGMLSDDEEKQKLEPKESDYLLAGVKQKEDALVGGNQYLYEQLLDLVEMVQERVLDDISGDVKALESSREYTQYVVQGIEAFDSRAEFDRFYKEYATKYGFDRASPTASAEDNGMTFTETLHSVKSVLKTSYHDDGDDDTANVFVGTQVVLSQMFRTVRDVNPKFQRLIDNMFEGKGEFRAGPIKTFDRSQAKVESDYADATFPRSLELKDIMRCSVMFDNPRQLQRAFQEFIEECKRVETIKVFRVKNTHSPFDGVDSDYRPRYRDVKVNVLFSYDKSFLLHSTIVGEVQLVLAPYIMLKKRTHKFYEISRKKRFFDAVVVPTLDVPWYVMWCSAFF